MHKLSNIVGALFLVAATGVGTPAFANDDTKQLEKARKHMELGQEAFHQQRYQEAATHFEDAYNASPFAAFLYNAGLALEKGGAPKGAIDFYRRYLKIDPEAEDAKMVREKIDALLAAEAPPGGATESPATATEKRPEVEITETEMKSLISIKTNPKDAKIRIISQAGKEISSAVGPLAQTVESGTYTIEASHPDFKTVTTDIFVSSGQVYFVVVEMSQGAFLGFLRVVSDTPSAAVFIDDRALGQAGQTPFSSVLPAGKHTIWVEKTGYIPVEKSVDIDISEEVELNLTLERPSFGAVLVKTNADNATVFIDSKPSGSVHINKPFRKQLPVGKHQVMVTRDGLKDYVATVEVKGGQETKLLVRLNAKPSRTSGWVSAGFSAALFATGGVLGGFALHIKKELDAERKDGTLASDDERVMRGFIFGVGADVSFGIGTIIACMSIYYFIRDPLPPSEGKTQAPVDYPITPNGQPSADASAAEASTDDAPAVAAPTATRRPVLLIAPLIGKETAGLGLSLTF